MIYTLGAALSKGWRYGQDAVARTAASGTDTMMPLVESGEIDSGSAMRGKSTTPTTGSEPPTAATENLRTVAVIFPLQAGLMVQNNSAIKSIKDLKGKTIAYGHTSQEVIRNRSTHAGQRRPHDPGRKDRAGAEPRPRHRRIHRRHVDITSSRSAGQGFRGRRRDRASGSCRSRTAGCGQSAEEGIPDRLSRQGPADDNLAGVKQAQWHTTTTSSSPTRTSRPTR